MVPTQTIIDDIRQGRMVILVDDQDRENEGDLVVAADKITEQHINFMAQFGRGLICMPMSKQRCAQLNLPMMVSQNNQSKFGTNFTVSIEAATGVTTGISVPDRTRTIQAAACADATAADIVQPGHIFPIRAQDGGVLVRAGHTEASCDLAQLAGLQPVAVICEILNEDGTMARRDQLEVFAKKHQLNIGTIEDLIRYRLEREPTVECLSSAPIETQWGTFELSIFESLHDGARHQVLSCGQQNQGPAWVRIQCAEFLSDLPGIASPLTAQGKWPLQQAMQAVAKQGVGALITLGYESSSADKQVNFLNKEEPVSPDSSSGQSWRDIGVGSQILRHLGFNQFHVLGPKRKFHGLAGFGLEVIDCLPYTEHQN